VHEWGFAADRHLEKVVKRLRPLAYLVKRGSDSLILGLERIAKGLPSASKTTVSGSTEPRPIRVLMDRPSRGC
jgi:hypothetical protein